MRQILYLELWLECWHEGIVEKRKKKNKHIQHQGSNQGHIWEKPVLQLFSYLYIYKTLLNVVLSMINITEKLQVTHFKKRFNIKSIWQINYLYDTDKLHCIMSSRKKEQYILIQINQQQ